MKRERHGRRLWAIEISDMDGLFFKDYVVKFLRHQGFTDIEIAKGSSNFGAEIIASKSDQRYAIQVKRKSEC